MTVAEAFAASAQMLRQRANELIHAAQNDQRNDHAFAIGVALQETADVHEAIAEKAAKDDRDFDYNPAKGDLP